MATYCQSGPAMQWKILSLAVASKLSLLWASLVFKKIHAGFRQPNLGSLVVFADIKSWPSRFLKHVSAARRETANPRFFP
jgi:hypothetical protein